eukprot:m.147179 g.147179  ORF g.147179 m.147179 type:complete len:704 (-) comp16254_c0_seq2:508-2619(-)
MRSAVAICLFWALVASTCADEYDPMSDFTDEDWDAAADAFDSNPRDNKVQKAAASDLPSTTQLKARSSNRQKAEPSRKVKIDNLNKPDEQLLETEDVSENILNVNFLAKSVATVPLLYLLGGLLVVFGIFVFVVIQQHVRVQKQQQVLLHQQQDHTLIVTSTADLTMWSATELVGACRRLCQRCAGNTPLSNELEALRDQAVLKLLSTISSATSAIPVTQPGWRPSVEVNGSLGELEELVSVLRHSSLGDSQELQERLGVVSSFVDKRRLEYTLSAAIHQRNLELLTTTLDKCKTQRILPSNHTQANELHRTLKLAHEMKAFIEARLSAPKLLALGPVTSDDGSINKQAGDDEDTNHGFVMVEEVEGEVSSTSFDEPLIEEPEALEAMNGILNCVGSSDARLERRLQHELSLLEVTQRHAWLRTNFEQVQAERRHRETLYQTSNHHENLMQEMRENTATAQAELERQQQNFEQQSKGSARERIDAHHQHVCNTAHTRLVTTLRNILMIAIVALLLGTLEVSFTVKNSSCTAPTTGWTMFSSFDPIQQLNNVVCRVSQFYTPIISGVFMVVFIAIYLLVASLAGQWPALMVTTIAAYYPLRGVVYALLPRLVHLVVPIILAVGRYMLDTWIARKARRQALRLSDEDPYRLDVLEIYRLDGVYRKVTAACQLGLACLIYCTLSGVGWYIAYRKSLRERILSSFWN